jgi:hypothetical protein
VPALHAVSHGASMHLQDEGHAEGGTMQCEGSCDMDTKKGHVGAMERGNECRKHELESRRAQGAWRVLRSNKIPR